MRCKNKAWADSKTIDDGGWELLDSGLITMKTFLLTCLLSASVQCLAADSADGFVPLFNGQNLDGWKVNENPATFTVKDGMLVANGDRAHLFYDGPVSGHNFKNFHLRVEAMTHPESNSGVYFHTEFQDAGWPAKGYEVQVNNTHKDPKKTAGLYGILDNFTAPAQDGKWFVMEVIVEGKHIVTKVDGKVVSDFVEPDPANPPKGFAGRMIGHGTFAIQGHDPISKVSYKRIEVKVLP